MKGINIHTVNKITLVCAKLAEILHWIGVISMAALLICSFVAKNWLINIFNNNIREIGSTLKINGFEMSIVNSAGSINITAVTLFSISAMIILFLFTMIFRNTYLILKTAKGKTWFSKGSTPFQKDIVRMIREIGIFLIAVPVIGFIMSVISRAVIGVDIAEISVNLVNIFIGLLMLCLSHFFAYGSELQKDVDGLL